MNIEDTIKAANLYKLALEENQAELTIPLKECIICYVPKMPHHHRSFWTEENLIIFYLDSSDEIYDTLRVSETPLGTIRKVYLCTANNADIDYQITKIACDFILLPFSKSLMPNYTEIDPKQMLRVIDLLSFI